MSGHGKSGTSRFKRVSVAVLVALLFVQVVLLGQRFTTGMSPSMLPPPLPTAIDSLRVIQGQSFRSMKWSELTVAGETTLLLVFSPACGWCDSVAADWSTLTASAPQRSFFLVTAASHAEADSYRAEQKWAGRLLVLDTTNPGGLEHFLISKTPWIYAIGEKGEILDDSHGVYAADFFARVSQ